MEILELTGTVEYIKFHNENNQYTIMEISTEEELVTVVGVFPYVSSGEDLKIYGNWVNHANFGLQFKAESFERIKPVTTAAILKYLSGGAVKGVGPATAQKIVDTFGENSLEVIENEPRRLTQIKGITFSKALAMSVELKNIFGIRELMLFLSKYGVSPDKSILVWKYYGGGAIDVIGENPFLLCSEGIELDFMIVDEIANLREIEKNDANRIRAGILYVLRHNANNGHSCIPLNKLISTCTGLLKIDKQEVNDAVFTLAENTDIIIKALNNDEFVFLPNLFNSEKYISERIRLMLRYPPRTITGIEEEIDMIERSNKVEYAVKQKEAIRTALDEGLLILTGGPGTGKTTTLNAVIQILQSKGETVFLAAPTGRAAKRMSDLTGCEAKTIHRMLQVDWDENDKPIFSRNESRPLECDTVIVDEVSMVDINVMEGLLAAMPLGCRMVLVGDTDQLPSVGAGSVLKDLIDSKIITTVELTEIFRQAQQSLIVMNSHSIVKGNMPVLNRVDSDFFFMAMNEEEKLLETVVDLVHRRLPNKYNYDINENIQVLCPGRKGSAGTETLNVMLRDRINPPSSHKAQATIMGTVFREGDKVMHIKNNYDLIWTKDDGTSGSGIFNGDMGIITEIDKAIGTLRIRVDDKEAIYEFEQAGQELEHAYAVTIHKSQGNEYSAVIIPLFRGTSKLKYRNLLYTGITRAKEILIIIGESRVLTQMIANDKKTLRYTGLLGMLLEDE